MVGLCRPLSTNSPIWAGDGIDPEKSRKLNASPCAHAWCYHSLVSPDLTRVSRHTRATMASSRFYVSSRSATSGGLLAMQTLHGGHAGGREGGWSRRAKGGKREGAH